MKYATPLLLALLIHSCTGALRDSDATSEVLVSSVDSDVISAQSSASQVISEHEAKNDLIVFVGEKIEVTFNAQERGTTVFDTVINGDTIYRREYPIVLDNCFTAKYKVLQLVSGSFDEDTIEFLAYDHYGEPAFSNYQTVLLFVSRNEGVMYHEKYQYFDLYITEGGSWASPYSTGDYTHPFKDSISVRPEKVNFKDVVSFPLGNLTSEEIERWYPEPYYDIHNGRATAVYGNYVKDLFKLKQETILKARGIY